jgi:uncharacterized protein (TIGR02302 family)
MDLSCYHAATQQGMIHADLPENRLTNPTPDPASPPRRPNAEAATGRLEGALARAKWVLLWEGLWPPLAMLLTVIGAFLALSWLGLWLWLPPIGRNLAIFVVVVFLAYALVNVVFALFRIPSRYDRLRRLDHVSGLAHRPATAIADEMATPDSDAWSKALWRAHVEQALGRLHSLRAGLPRPRLMLRDPFAVRALVLILLIATFVAAGGERIRRITALFDWQGVVVPPNFRLDAWVSPPNYTAKPPVILPGVRPGDQPPVDTAAVSVPVGSVLIIRASGQAQLDVAVKGGLQEVAGDQRPQAPAGTEERRYTITDRGTATLRGIGNDDIVWAFNAIPDKPPTISLAKDPEAQSRGQLALSYRLEDDYGVAEAQATFALKDQSSGPRPLFGPPDFPLALPQARTRNGVGQTTKDLAEHPWAGAKVDLTLTAKDDAGNEGRSEPYELTLPERIFVNPLARALIEQRRDLALDAEARDRVLIALDALTIAPEKFVPEVPVYLALRGVVWNLASAKSDEDLRGVVKRLWDTAVQIEDGNLSDAEAALRQAQERLKDALERGASDDEIKKLMDELRAALDKYLQALAEQLRKNPQMARPLDPNMSRMMSQRDLQNMIDKLEQANRSARELAKILAKQQQLRDRTSKESGEPQLGTLSRDQDQLLQYLKRLTDQLPK